MQARLDSETGKLTALERALPERLHKIEERQANHVELLNQVSQFSRRRVRSRPMPIHLVLVHRLQTLKSDLLHKGQELHLHLGRVHLRHRHRLQRLKILHLQSIGRREMPEVKILGRNIIPQMFIKTQTITPKHIIMMVRIGAYRTNKCQSP